MKRLLVLFTISFAIAVQAADPPKEAAPKFVMSKEEQLALDNLKQQKQIISLQIELASRQFKESITKFVADVVAAHNNPKGVSFDADKLEFVTEQPKAQDKK